MTHGNNQLTKVKGSDGRLKDLIEDGRIDAIDVALVRGLSTIVYTVVSNETNPLYVRLNRLADEKIVKKHERQGYNTCFSVDKDTAAEKLLTIIDSDHRLKQKYYVDVLAIMEIVLKHMETDDKLLKDISYPINKSGKRLLRTGYDESKNHIDFYVLE